ncbi:hypothetical protein [Phenylobacterium immobile]|uniref:hypothetical protein n=1 Tax=Phenylobacterium immobile TaxID=21 RepID=UPI000A8CD194|nr:hypothetical protein [Phenylobacterium immobile]
MIDRSAEAVSAEAVSLHADIKSDLREAYERGRRDERATRKRHPIAMTITVVAAAVGLVVMGLAAVNGSFSRAGGVVDQNLTVAADRAEPVVRDAAADAGQSLRNAGDKAKSDIAR